MHKAYKVKDIDANYLMIQGGELVELKIDEGNDHVLHNAPLGVVYRDVIITGKRFLIPEVSIEDVVEIGKECKNHIYFASPYSKYDIADVPTDVNVTFSKKDEIKQYCLDAAFRHVSDIASMFLEAGLRKMYVPISASHPLCRHVDASDYTIWAALDESFERLADAIVVVGMQTIEKSTGVGCEIENAIAAGKPVYWFDPEPFKERWFYTTGHYTVKVSR